MGNILTELRAEAFCRKIHIVNGACAARNNLPLRTRQFNISIPMQFCERLFIEKGEKIYLICDYEKKCIYALPKKFVQTLDLFTHHVLQAYFEPSDNESQMFIKVSHPHQLVEKALYNKTMTPKLFSFMIPYQVMIDLKWPIERGTKISIKLIDEQFLKVCLYKEGH